MQHNPNSLVQPFISKNNIKKTEPSYSRTSISPQEDGSIIFRDYEQNKHYKIPVRGFEWQYNQIKDSYDLAILSRSGTLRTVYNADINGFNKETGIDAFDTLSKAYKTNFYHKTYNSERFIEKDVSLKMKKSSKPIEFNNAIIEPANGNGPLIITSNEGNFMAPNTTDLHLAYDKEKKSYTVFIKQKNDKSIVIKDAKLQSIEHIRDTPGIEKFQQDYKRLEKMRKLEALQETKHKQRNIYQVQNKSLHI